jgi:putative ABC transport system permease protein
VSETFARRHGLELGSTVTLLTPRGRDEYIILGLAAVGPAMALGGNFIVMDLNAAQLAFHKVGTLDRIDLALHPGVAVDAMQDALQARLGPGVRSNAPPFATPPWRKCCGLSR